MSKLSALVNKLTVFVGKTIRLYVVDMTGAPIQGYVELDDIIDNVKASATDLTGGKLDSKLTVGNEFTLEKVNPSGYESLLLKYINRVYSTDRTEYVLFDANFIAGIQVLTFPPKSGILALLDDALIYKPSTQPAISASTLTLDCTEKDEAMFEGRLSVGTLTINSDFTIALANVTATNLISCVLSLTGTRNITMPADVLVSNPSSLGDWSAKPILEITAGTDDVIEFQFLRYATNSKWLLKVSEVAV